MNAFFEWEFNKCGAMYSSSISLSKHKSVPQYKRFHKFTLSDIYLSP